MNVPVTTTQRRVPISEDAPTPRLIEWTLERFESQRLVMTTSFGMEGCALIDMYARKYAPLFERTGNRMPVIYLDTMFFFPETYSLRDRMVERYPMLDFINRGTTMTPEAQAREHGAELWKNNPDLCCRIRKVDPMYEVMAGVDVWITGLRRSQSVTRANLQVVDWDWRYQVLKVSPLARWERPEVWAYVKKNDVPYNELHERGYPTVGCTHCTKPVPGSSPDDYTRAGRWSDSEKTECGLHGGEGI